MSRSEKPLVMKGLYPATVTPFNEDLSIDYDGLKRHLAETAAGEDVQGIVVNAFLGEILQLTDEEKVGIIKAAREVLKPGQVLIAGIEARGTAFAVKEGLLAKSAGADALLVLPGFDVRPYRRLATHIPSVYAFFEALDREVGLPMIIFNYPENSGCSYSIEALAAIAKLKNVVAVKATSGTVSRFIKLWDALKDELSILAAVDAPHLLGMLLQGGHGALIGISVIGPDHWSRMVKAALSGDVSTAQKIHHDFCVPLMDSVFDNQEGNSPISEVACVKEALVQLGQFKLSKVRPLAVDVTPERSAYIRRSLEQIGLLSAN